MESKTKIPNNQKTKMSFEEITLQYKNICAESLNLNFLVRATELQKEQVKKLRIFKNQIKACKYQAIERKNEFLANSFFHFQCSLNSISSILNMWIALKEEKYQDSWSFLIDAQEYIYVALRASDKHYGLEEYIKCLEDIEKTIFPSWPLYNSPGIIETCGKCSICGEAFDGCDHLEGLIYLGRLCQRVERKPIKIDHSALVENPQDKRCIITKLSTEDGKMQDYITLRVLGEKADISKDNIGSIQGIILNFEKLDFD